MAMNKAEKQQVIADFVGIFREPGFYLMDFKGLNVAEITELRVQLREAKASMRVVKNTLAKRALAEVGITGIDSFFVGPTGIIWSAEDAVTPARVLSEFLKKHDKASIKACMVEGLFVKENELGRLATLPTKKELYGQVAAALSAPITKLAATLNAAPQQLVGTLDALRTKREETAA